MKRKSIALYDPYLDVMGGGERHILSIFKIFTEQGFDPHIFWDDDVTAQIQERLNLNFPSQIMYEPNIFRHSSSVFEKLRQLKEFDVFIYVTDGSYFFSSAKKNIIFCMVPQKSLYNMSPLNKLKTANSIFISNSHYTHNWLKRWGIHSKIIYPYLDDKFISTDISKLKKEKIILSVGRFFKHLHSKRQDIIINIFTKLQKQNPQLQDYKLVLAGSLKNEDTDYFDELQALAKQNTAVELHANLTHEELYNLYCRSSLYWHFAGYGVEEAAHPEQVEHLGITPLEAMATGNISMCYQAGGPKELIKDGENGFLFQNEEELAEKTLQVIADNSRFQKIQLNAKQFVTEKFSYEVFKDAVKKTLL